MPTPCGSVIVPFAGLERLTMKFSVPSERLSPETEIEIVPHLQPPFVRFTVPVFDV